jgi:hypothetical protein
MPLQKDPTTIPPDVSRKLFGADVYIGDKIYQALDQIVRFCRIHIWLSINFATFPIMLCYIAWQYFDVKNVSIPLPIGSVTWEASIWFLCVIFVVLSVKGADALHRHYYGSEEDSAQIVLLECALNVHARRILKLIIKFESRAIYSYFAHTALRDADRVNDETFK